MQRLAIAGLVFFSGLLHSADVRGETSGLVWLERMSRALDNSRYEGEVVYAEGSQMQSISVRQSEPGQEHAWPKGEPNRSQQRGIGMAHAADSASVSPARPMPGIGGWSSALIKQNYQLIDHGDNTRYGYQLREIEVRPRDRKRFGYRVWIDHQTMMPIRWDWYCADGKLTRQLKFASLRMLEHAQPSNDDAADAVPDREATPSESVELELGFVMTAEPLARLVALDGTHLERYLLSDGLASVSLYRGGPGWASEFEGIHALGPLHLTALRDGESSLLLLGEVPAETLQRLARVAGEHL